MQTEFIDALIAAGMLDLPFVFGDGGLYFSGVVADDQKAQIEALYQQHYKPA